MEGFVKLYRSIERRPWYGEANTMAVYMHLAIKADYKTDTMQTTIKSIAEALHISRKECRTALQHLADAGDLQIEALHKKIRATRKNPESKEPSDFEAYQEEAKGHKDTPEGYKRATRRPQETQTVTAFAAYQGTQKGHKKATYKEYIYNNIYNKNKKNKNYIEREYKEDLYKQLIDN